MTDKIASLVDMNNVSSNVSKQQTTSKQHTLKNKALQVITTSHFYKVPRKMSTKTTSTESETRKIVAFTIK